MAKKPTNDEMIIEAQIKSIVNTILENCKSESEGKALRMPLEDYEDRVAYYTGLSKESLYKLLNNKPIKNIQQSYTLVHHIIIIKALLKFYDMRQQPNFIQLFEKVKDVFPAEDIVQFRHAMTAMGFDYRQTINGLTIAEDAKLTFERFHYLKKIKKLRSVKAHICYLDERYIDKKLIFNKPNFEKDGCTGSNDSTHIWEGFYLYHALSDTGLESYLITNKICKLVYRKWVFDVLLKVIKPGCTIIIDDHPLHGELEVDSITPYHQKADMISWLRKRNIPCDETMYKAELFEIISKCQKPTAYYDFDRLLKARGHDVLRVPTGFKELSPIPLFWIEVSKRMPSLAAESATVNLEDTIISTIKTTHTAVWKQIKQIIIHSEGPLEALHAETEAALEKCEPFDVKNVNSHANIPEYFYVLDKY